MPVAAADVFQRIANFLAIGTAPAAIDGASAAKSGAEGEFSAHLAGHTPPLVTGEVMPAGKDLPADRQIAAELPADPAAEQLDKPAEPATLAMSQASAKARLPIDPETGEPTDRHRRIALSSPPTAERSTADDTTQDAEAIAATVLAPVPIIPSILVPPALHIHSNGAMKLAADDPAAVKNPPALDAQAVAANPDRPAAASSIPATASERAAWIQRAEAMAAIGVEARSASPAAQTRPAGDAGIVSFVAKMDPAATASSTRNDNAATPAATGAKSPPADAAGFAAQPFQPASRAAPAAQKIVAGARQVGDADDTSANRPSTALDAIGDDPLSAMTAPAGHRPVAAPAASPDVAPPIADRVAALVETIQLLRNEAKSDLLSLSVDHDELGKITMRFDRANDGVSVRFDSPDPSVTQLIAHSAQALKTAGDAVGMRFERHDGSSSGAGTSRDTPRQGTGQDRNQTSYAPPSPPRPRRQRDGIFA